MSRMCDFCEKREAKLKCNDCRQAYCDKCTIKFMGYFQAFVTCGLFYVVNGFSFPRHCRDRRCERDNLVKF